MNIIICFLLLTFINSGFTMILYNNQKFNQNFNHNLNRLALRCVIFKEKKLIKIMKNLKNNLDIYHNKSIVCVAEGIISYNDLSEDEKTLIEAVISLCY